MNRKSTIIIAEAGVNHNGSIQIAKRLIKAASKAGADIVKFQLHISEEEMVENAPNPPYFKNETRNIQKDINSLKLSI